MGIFSTSSPFDAEVEKATDEKNTKEEWGLIMDICDRVDNNQQNAKDCLKSILKRLAHQDPHIALHAITLLDACVNNCGKVFHLEVASRDFETEFKKLINKSNPSVVDKLKQLLRTWAEGEFKTDPQLSLIPSLYQKLKSEGMDFPQVSSASTKGPKSTALAKDSTVDVSQQEAEDIAKAIALSLKESESSPKSKVCVSSSSSLYPTASINSSSTASEGRKVRALYDFEAAEDNELTFKAGEIIHVTDDADPNWWKGTNKRGEGLFPASFVTSDLTSESESIGKAESRKTVQFNDSVSVKNIKKEPVEVEINEAKMDRLLHYLHEADPRDDSGDPTDMHDVEEEVNAMGPLIDSELERIDTKHAQLTQLSSDLVEALNLYHSLMREPPASQGINYPHQTMSKPAYGGYMAMPPGQFNGPGPSSIPYMPPYVTPCNSLQHLPNGPQNMQPFVPDQHGSMPHMNGAIPYGTNPGAVPPYHMQHGPHMAHQPAGPPPPQQQQQQQQQQQPGQPNQQPPQHRYQNNTNNPPLL